jgi:hypothetical protein
MKTPEEICPDFPEWPDRWMIVEKDKAYGQGLLDAMRPFVEHLIAMKLKKKTIRTHMDNLWLLGGEIIRSVHIYQEYNVPPIEKLRDSVDSKGGPYSQHLDSEWAINSMLHGREDHILNLINY